jgi:hypothetical protein
MNDKPENLEKLIEDAATIYTYKIASGSLERDHIKSGFIEGVKWAIKHFYNEKNKIHSF